MSCIGCDEAVSGLCPEHGAAEAYADEMCARADGRLILNLTQHAATPDQVAAGIRDPYDHHEVRDLLTFTGRPYYHDMDERAHMLAGIAREQGYRRVMIGGAPYFMSRLEAVLIDCDLWPCYAYSDRESVDTIQPDGSVRKTQVFRHLGLLDVIGSTSPYGQT